MYHFGALAGVHRGLTFDRELLYTGAMFHDLGLMPDHRSPDQRFEVDGVNAARDFLRSHGVPEQDVYTVWTAIALPITPGIPVHMHPVIADREPGFHKGSFCSVIRNSRWPGDAHSPGCGCG